MLFCNKTLNFSLFSVSLLSLIMHKMKQLNKLLLEPLLKHLGMCMCMYVGVCNYVLFMWMNKLCKYECVCMWVFRCVVYICVYVCGVGECVYVSCECMNVCKWICVSMTVCMWVCMCMIIYVNIFQCICTCQCECVLCVYTNVCQCEYCVWMLFS